MKNNMSVKKVNIQILLTGLLLLAAGTLSLLYWGGKKEVWFCDEIYSYESANGFEQNWPMSYTGQWMTGDDVDAFFAADGDSLSLRDVSVRLYSDHVPLYFWLFRAVGFFYFKGSGTIWIGLSINLLFYLIFLDLGYLLFCRLTKHPLLSGMMMFLTCVVNRLMLEQATILRMYMMLLLAEGLLLLGGFWILREASKNRLSPAALLYLFFVSVAGFLTHYDFWIFYAAEASVFCLWLLILSFRKSGKKGKSGKSGKRFWSRIEFRYAAAWSACFAASLSVTIRLFPYCRWNLNRGKGQMALTSLFDFSGEKIRQIVWGYEHLSTSLFGTVLPVAVGLSLVFCCILGGWLLLYRSGEHRKAAGLALTVLTTQAYQLVVCFTMPAGAEERYLWGTYTIMMLCAAWSVFLLLRAGLSKIEDKKIRKAAQWITALVLAFCIPAGQMSMIDGGKNIPYLFYEEKDVDLLEANRDIPWIVYTQAEDVYSCYDWRIPERICFLTPDCTDEDRAALKKLQSERFVLYVYEPQLPGALEFLERELGQTNEARYLTRSTNYTVYLVERVR